MNKFCSIFGIIILGIFNIYSGCNSCKGGGNGGGKGVSSKNKKGKSMKGKSMKGKSMKGDIGSEGGEEGEDEEEGKEEGGGEGEEEEKDKEALINKISGFINDSSAYNSEESLNQFEVKINDDNNKVEITFEGDHFKATSVEGWNEIEEDPESAIFTISFKTNNKDKDLYWKFKDENKISLKNLRKSLAKIGDKYRENRKSHYLCVKDETNVLQNGDNCHIDLSDGIVYRIANIEGDDNIRMHMCAPGVKNNQNKYLGFFTAGYYDCKYYYLAKNNKYVDSKDGTRFRNARTDGRFIPEKQFMDDIGELTIIT